jgi:WD40 repeat protein
VLLDFGLARETDGGATVTASGGLVGTPAYMAPEQLSSARSPVDRRADVYALGVTLYECLTLERPFQAPTRERLYQSILTERPPTPRRFNASVPRDVEVVLETALEKDVDRRYASALDLAEELRRIRQREPIRARPAGVVLRATRWLQRNRILAAALGALFLALAAGLAVALFLLDRAQVDRRIAERNRLIAQAHDLLRTDPCLALLLAIEGAREAPGLDANNVLLQAIDDLRERRVHETPPQLRSREMSPDGRFLVTVSYADAPRVWDGETWASIDVLEGHEGEINGLAFSDDSRFLATSADDGTTRVWSTVDWRPVHVLRDPLRYVNLLGFDAGARHLATWSSDFTRTAVRSWDLEREEALTVEEGELSRIHRAQIGPDGGTLIVEPTIGVRVWESAGGVPHKVFERENPVPGHGLNALISPDGTKLLVAWERGGMLWDLVAGEQLCALESRRAGIGMLAFRADGRRMLVGRAEGYAEIRAVPNGDIVCELSELGNYPSFSPDGEHVLANAADGRARIWDAETGRVLATFAERTAHPPRFARSGLTVITAATTGVLRESSRVSEGQRTTLPTAPGRLLSGRFDLSGHRIAVGTDLDEILVVELDPGAWSADVRIPAPGGVRCLALAPDGRSVVVTALEEAAPEAVRRIDTSTGAVLSVFRHGSSKVYDVRFAADGRRLLTAADDGKARIFDAETAEQLLEIQSHDHGVRTASFTRGGERILTTSEVMGDASVRLWDSRSGAQLAHFEAAGEQPVQACLSPDERRVLASCWRGKVCLWDLATGEPRPWSAHPDHVVSAAFSPDGTRIVTASGSEVRLWDAETCVELMTVEAERTDVRGAAFSADGRWIVTLTSDAIRLRPSDPLQRAQQIAPRSLTDAERERYRLTATER